MLFERMKKQMLRVVVTGATSMVGVALIKNFLIRQKDVKIYAVVKPESKRGCRLPKDKRVEIIGCDMNDYASLTGKIMEKCDVFYHLAWPRTSTHIEKYEDVIYKAESIRYEIEAVEVAHCLGCNKFIGAGTQAEYGVGISSKITEETACNPVSIDGIAHIAAYQFARVLAQKYGMVFIWARIFSVYGINDRENSMIKTTINKLINGEECRFTSGEQRWDYLYEDDIGEAFYLMESKCNKSEIYCIANGNSMLLKEYIEVIRNVVSPNADMKFGEVANTSISLDVNTERFRRDTGWMPKTEFEEGIRNIYIDICEKKSR